MKKLLIVGYGNPDRGDDGVAWHMLKELLKEHKPDLDAEDLLSGDIASLDGETDTWFNLQLLPEISELLSDYEKAVFIDAHTAEIKAEINLEKIEPVFLNSPFTHHVTPSTCLSLVESINGYAPESWLLSIRGYEFRFERELTTRTRDLANKAVKILRKEFLG